MEILARWLDAAGIRFIFEQLPQRNLLLVLNYHRIGNPDESPFDPGVFSATAEEFEAEVKFISRRLNPVTLSEAIQFIEANGNDGRSCCRSLITFDDGYVDNFEIAFPILRKAGIQGVFFLPTSLIGTQHVPWWDLIAYLVKSARNRRFVLRYPSNLRCDLETTGLRETLRRVLDLFKRPEMKDPERFIAELESACAGQRPHDSGARCFMNWDEVGALAGGGMALGAHTHSHRILGRLSADEQHQELLEPRKILQEKVGVGAETIAYPVGAKTSFTQETKMLAERLGYRAAFSFYGGVNRPGEVDCFDVRRVGVDGQSVARFRVQSTIAALTDRFWP